MLEILRDPVWQSIGVFVGAAIAIAIYLGQRPRTEFSAGVLSSRALLAVDQSLSSRVSVTIDGVVVRDVHLVVLALKNSGNQPIRAAAFERSLQVTFGTGSQILSAEVTRQKPENLGASLEQGPDALVLQPLLLNPGDSVVLQALVAARAPKVTFDVRIEGVSGLKPLTVGREPRPSFTARVGIAAISAPFIAALFWMFVTAFDSLFGANVREALTIDGSLAFGLLVIAVAAFVLEELVNYLRERLLHRGQRTIDDA